MAEGVKYIKVSKVDREGVDQTLTLQSLTELTIPYSTGNYLWYSIYKWTAYLFFIFCW